MKDIKDYEKEEKAIKYNKPKGRVLLFGFCFLFSIAIFIHSLHEIINVLVFDKINFDMNMVYIAFIFSLFILFGSIVQLIGYFGDEIIISESFIMIRKAAFGKVYKVSQRCIIAKDTTFTSVKGLDFYVIILYLKNGKRINTGDLNCKGKDINKIDEKFKFKKFTSRKALKEEGANLNNIQMNEGDFVSKTNHFIQVTTFFPLILLIIVVFLLASGFNYKCGVQESINVNGIVVNHKIEKNKDNETYNITVLEDKTNEKYNIMVNRIQYKEFYLRSKIKITGKKGKLGILFDIMIQKVK
jgi:hypothetical protein